MRIVVVTLLYLTLVAFIRAEALDEALHVKTHDDVFREMIACRAKLSAQAGGDLAIAVRCLEREAFDYSDRSLSEEEKEALFVALIDERSPRQIILTAACVARARTCGGLNGNPLEQLDHAGREFRGHLVSFSGYALRTYLRSKRPNQSPEPTAMSVTPPAAQESRQP